MARAFLAALQPFLLNSSNYSPIAPLPSNLFFPFSPFFPSFLKNPLPLSHWPRRALFSTSVISSMTSVTRKNFKEALEQLKHAVEAADFVAVDLEMSGVLSAPWRRNMELDTVDIRYYNLRDSAHKFQVLQCGVCPFRWDKASNKYVAHPYNFYLFPRNDSQLDSQAHGFFCQTSSLEFLAKHQFDFNACIYDGISYLSREREEAARLKLGSTDESENEVANRDMSPEVPLIRTSDVIFSERIRIQVGQWKDNLASGMRSFNAKNKIQSSLASTLHIDVMDDHQAKLARQVLFRHYKNLAVSPEMKAGSNGHKQLTVMFASSHAEKTALLTELLEDNKRRLEAKLLENVGFRHVIDSLANSGKPVVGHNCMLDFAHIYHKFFAPLPAEASEFCRSLHRHFSCIVDTKYLMKAEPTLRELLGNASTTLSAVYSYICQDLPRKGGSHRNISSHKPAHHRTFQQVKLEIASEIQRYEGTESKHEAGFDAYMTGAVFAQLCHYLKVDATCIRSLPEQVKLGEMGLASYTNLLYLGWVGQLVLDLTTGEEATGVKALRSRGMPGHNSHHKDVALIWGNYMLGTVQDLQKQLKDWFSDTAHKPIIDIFFIDKRSAFLVFRTCGNLARELISAYKNRVHGGSSQSSSFTTKLITSGIRIASFEAFERLCKSPLSTQTLADSAEVLVYGDTDFSALAKEIVSATHHGKYSEVQGTDDGKVEAQVLQAFNEFDDSGRILKHDEAQGLEQRCMAPFTQATASLNVTKRKANMALCSNMNVEDEGDARSCLDDRSSIKPLRFSTSKHSERLDTSNDLQQNSLPDRPQARHDAHKALSDQFSTQAGSRKKVRMKPATDDIGQ